MTESFPAIPSDFSKRIHQALKAWSSQSRGGLLNELVLARSASDTLEVSPRLTTNQILMDGLDQLKRVDAEASDLLQRRFLDQQTAQAVAYRLNQTEDSVYQRQRAAIVQLAQVIWEQEMAMRHSLAQRSIAHLESPTYTRLFGVAEMLMQLRAKIESASSPWILALEGMGGIGKTTLADALARDLAYSVCFHNIAWISFRQRFFRLPGSIETLPAPPGLSPTELVDRLIEQFELVSLKRQSDHEKWLGLKAYLQSHPSLVIIDNLETLPDYRLLADKLRELTNPSKFLLTTRYSLRGESGVYIFPLLGLPRVETMAFIRYEAELQNLPELAQSPEATLAAIYELTQGNPLATKLIIGQMHTFTLPTILERLKQVQDSTADKLLSFIYADAWQTLDVKHRYVLKVMLAVPDVGGNLEHIAGITTLGINETAACLHRLTILSLVTVLGGLDERRYALHPLAQNFIAQQPDIDW